MPEITSDEKDINTILPILHRISLFGGIHESDLRDIYEQMIQVRFAEGELIFQQGSQPSDIYIVVSGAVNIMLEGDKNIDLIEFGVGQCFGETSVIGILPHSATAVAKEETVLLALSGLTLLELHDKNPTLFGHFILNIAREACRRLYRTNEMMLHYAHQH